MSRLIKDPAGLLRSLCFTLMGILAVIQFFPLVWLLDFSLLKNSQFFVSGFLVWPDPPQWINYFKAWTDGNIPRYLFNSVIVTGMTVLVTVLLSLTLGYAFTRIKWKFRGFFYTLIILGIMIPIHSTLLPNYLVFSKFKILDTYTGLIIPYIAFSMPLGVFLMSGFLESIPRSLEESATIDGCGLYRIIFQIIFPLTKPVTVSIIIMTFMNCWNEFIMAATYLSSQALRTLPFAVYSFVGLYGSDYAVQFACMFLATLPALIIYICLNEQITKGITVGSVKG